MSRRKLPLNFFIFQAAVVDVLMAMAADFKALLLNGLDELGMALAPRGGKEEGRFFTSLSLST